MTQTELIEEWWNEPGEGDASMEEEHGEFWDSVLDQVIDTDLNGKAVLDFGCNRGGLLRLIADRFSIEKGTGIDIAAQSVEVANQNKGDRPISYEAKTALDFNQEFDVAISTAVIYLIQDMADHARQVYDALKPGGIYYVTHPDYTQSKGGAVLIEEINKFASVKAATNTLDDITKAFEGAGFKVSIKRMEPSGYFSVSSKSTWFRSVYDKLEHEYVERYAFKLEKQVV